ncbi:MAG: HsdM family class I SAM-dependent methyltransferase [Candidatus Hodarchaeales archaeon]
MQDFDSNLKIQKKRLRVSQVNEKSFNSEQEIKSEIKNIFDQIHEYIYSKGGIKPVNAAIDELGKLIFLWVHLQKDRSYKKIAGKFSSIELERVFSPDFIMNNSEEIIHTFKELFQEINQLPLYQWRDSNNKKTSIFPFDEPFRLTDVEVLAFSVNSINQIGNLLEKAKNDYFRSTDLLGELYETFLRGKYEGAGGLGTYLTPTEITECVCDMAFSLISNSIFWEFTEENEGEIVPKFLVGDICCGTGRFLINSLKNIEERILNSVEESEISPENYLSQIKHYSLFGADQAASSLWKARMNLLLYGGNFTNLLEVKDSITSKEIDDLQGKFNVLLTNPPFGEGTYSNPEGLEKMRKKDLGLSLGWSLQNNKPLTSVDPALLFIDRNLQLLKPGGILGIVLPDGILSNNQLLKYLFGYYDEKSELVLNSKAVPIAVVSLPTVTFSISGAIAKTSFLILRKIQANENLRKANTIFIATAEHIGFLKRGNLPIIDPEGNELLMIADLFKKYLLDKKINFDDYSVNVSLVSESRIINTLDAKSFDRRITEAKQIVYKSGYKTLKVKNAAMIRKKTLYEKTHQIKYYISILHVNQFLEIDWNSASNYTPSSKGQRCYPGDILFSCINPITPRIATIPKDIDGEILCSPEFAVLQVNIDINPHYLALALHLPSSIQQVAFKATGTSSSRRRIKKEIIGEIIIPILGLKKMKEYSEIHSNALSNIELERSRNRKVIKQFKDLIEMN